MPSIFRKHLNSSAWILLCSSAVSVHVSHAYRNIVMTRARINLILSFILMFLSFQMIFSLASAAIVWAALESTSLLEPSSQIMAPRYLKWSTGSNFWPCIVMSLCKAPLFVIILVFSALISMPNFASAVSKLCTSSVSSSSSPVIPSCHRQNGGLWSVDLQCWWCHWSSLGHVSWYPLKICWRGLGRAGTPDELQLMCETILQ